ncbi:MAG TPA: AarF/UbiB family protein [Usitatibacter sp.]|nr:AarF/UbiB family protein [Usitatibacter sp.]
MKIQARHLQRYKQIAALLWKYGRSDLVNQLGIDEAVAEERKGELSAAGRGNASQLADDLEAMGPTFVKLGQILSGRPDLLPPAYIEALTRLQDSVKPFSDAEALKIVEDELGARISKAFLRFDPEPLAAASLGQVHRAALRDGREVVVKVQRPNIASQIADDFEVLAEMAGMLEGHSEWMRRRRIRAIIEELRVSISHELDYEREAQNLVAMGANLAEFDRLYVPQPIADYCTRRVLTMEFVSGTKITKLSPLARMEMDGAALADQLFAAYLKQVLVHGLFHADPHPGNVFITDNGYLALLDLGMVGRTTPGLQEQLLRVLIAVSEGKAETATEVIARMSETGPDFNRVEFDRKVGQIISEQHGLNIQQINVGRTLLAVTGTAADHSVYVPSQLTLLAKTLLQLDQVGKTLDPEFDPNAAIRRHSTAIMSDRMQKQSTTGSVMASVLEMKDFVAGLPARLNRIMDAVGNRELEVKVHAMEAGLMMEGLQKVANRITSGLILAALIIGAALLMRVETSFRVLGYPGLAILCFLAAATGGVWLLANIFIQDKRSEAKAPR